MTELPTRVEIEAAIAQTEKRGNHYVTILVRTARAYLALLDAPAQYTEEEMRDADMLVTALKEVAECLQVGGDISTEAALDIIESTLSKVEFKS